MLRRGSAAAAHEAGVEVEGRGQRGKAGVVDDGEACEDLDLLPAMKTLPQSSRHLTQGLSVKDEEREGEEK